jgi:hypothetical protein
MDELGRKIVREGLFEAIEHQMKEGKPPETKKTFDRLRAAGHSRKETMKLIVYVLICEMNEMIKEHRAFDEAVYVKALKALPRLPWEDEPED